MGPGPDGPMGAMGAMEPHHMNGSLGGFKHLKNEPDMSSNKTVRDCIKFMLKSNCFSPSLPQVLGIWMGCQR